MPGLSGGAASYSPTFSADGQFLVFTSHANNLVTNDSNEIWLDVFVRTLPDGPTVLVSVSRDGFGGGDGNSFNPSISSNGQFIAFESAAGNLAANDTNGVNDVFVRDMIAGTTTLISVSTNSASSGDRASRFPVFTPDGRWLAFESTASNLVADDTNSLKDIFVRDRENGVTFYASTGSSPPGTGSESPSISANGRWVAFASDAVFGSAKPRSTEEVYVRDLASGTTIWASTNAYGLASTNSSARVWSYYPAISSDGRFVAFKTAFSLSANQPTATNLYIHDLQTQTTTLVSSNVWEESFPEITPDGGFVAFEAHTNVYLWDSQTGSNTLVSVDESGNSAAAGTSFRPVLTPDA